MVRLMVVEVLRLFSDNTLSPSRDIESQSLDLVSTPPSLDKKYTQAPFLVRVKTPDRDFEEVVKLYSLFRNAYASAIFENYETLRTIMDRHEALIRRRWKKKSYSERRKCLEKAWPYIPITHRPDSNAWSPLPAWLRTNTIPGAGERTECCMWPDLNLEDLAQPEPLPLMLRARSSAHDPSCFADADIDTCLFAWWKEMIKGYGSLSAQFAHNYSVFRTQQTAGTYGEIKQCDIRCTHKGLAPCRVGYPVGQGVVLLQVQERIYNFLVEVCKKILHDKDTSELTGSHIPVVPRPPEDDKALTCMGSLKAAAIRAPYRVPAEMDMGRMLKMVSAKVDAAEDHLHSMREDPAYFADVLQEYEAHDLQWLHKRQEMHDIAETYEEFRITTSFPAAYALFWPKAWSGVLQKLQKLAAVLSRSQCKVEEDLPPELDAAYTDVIHYLQDMEVLIASNLKEAFISTPCVRPFFRDWLPVGDWWDDPNYRYVDESDFQHMHNLLLGFEKLDDIVVRQMRKPHILLDELDTLRNISDKVTAEPLVDPYVAAMMSDMAIVAECRRQLALFQPWARHYHGIWVPSTKENRHVFWGEEIKYAWSNFSSIFPGFLDEEIESHVLPASEKLYYPIQQQEAERDSATKEYLESLRNAGWHAGEYIERLLAQGLERTPDWKPAAPALPPPTLQPLANHMAALAVADVPRRFKPTAVKVKVKTRGAAAEKDQGPAAADEKPKQEEKEKVTVVQGEEEIEEQVLPPFFTGRVNNRAAKVFDALFHREGAPHGRQGEVKWVDFLYAMSAVGFRGEHLAGSAWEFTPAEAGAIQFHEPHPSRKIPFLVARKWGWRLRKHYNWGAK